MRKLKSQINPNSQIKNSRQVSWLLIFGISVVVCNFVSWNLPCSYAQNKIIAIVNNDVITQKDLDDFINFMRVQLSREYNGAELAKQLQTLEVNLLDKLIEDRLILQEAKKTLEEAKTKKDIATVARLDVGQDRVKARINEIRRRYASDAELQNDLAGHGLVLADIEDRIKEQLLMYNIVELKIRNRVIIRPEEVTSFYNSNIKEFMAQEERELEVIALENADLAKTLAYNLKSGQKLTDLATRYSVTADTLKVTQGGDLRKDIEDAIFNLGIGEITEPIKVNNKYYIFKLNDIIPPRQQVLSEVQEKIHVFLFQKKMQEELTKWLEELKKQSYVKITQN